MLDQTTGGQLVYGGGLGAWHVLEEWSGPLTGATLVAEHVYGRSVDELIRSDRDRTGDGVLDAAWFHADEQNSVMAATDSTGAVLERYAYGDYGVPTVLAPDGVTVRVGGTLVGNRTLYTGRLWLASLGGGVYDYRYRVLDPRTGRFAQRDPLGFVDGINLYQYVNDGPYDGTDPLGLWDWDGDWLQMGIGGLLGYQGAEAQEAGWKACSKASIGVVGALSGGLFDSKHAYFGYAEDVLEWAGQDSCDVTSDSYRSGLNGGRAAVAAVLAGQLLKSLGINPTLLHSMEIHLVGRATGGWVGRLTPHVQFSSNGVVAHGQSTGLSGLVGGTKIKAISEAGFAGRVPYILGRNALGRWVSTVGGIPVRNSAAVTSGIGSKSSSGGCIGAALGGFLRGLGLKF